MEQVQDSKMNGVSVANDDQHEKMDVTSTVNNDNQPEKMDVTSTVNNDNQPEKMDVTSTVHNDDNNQPENENEIVQDEEELPDARSGSDDDNSYDNDDDDDDLSDIDYELLNQEDELPSHLKGSYKIVNEDEIQQYQEQDISTVFNTLSISRAIATVLLLRHNWNVEAAIQAWTADANGMREELGLLEFLPAGPDSPATENRTCELCSGNVAEYPGYDAFCSHKFCNTCWKVLIKKSLIVRCLIVRCPVEACNAVMNPDLVRLLAVHGDQTLYSSLFTKSYLINNIKGKWCPTLGCNHAVILEPGKTISNFTCKCLFSFCYRCLQESHKSISCALAECWSGERVKQSHNWQQVFYRYCPICYRSVPVAGQYKHMECLSCNYHFCSTCLCSWLENGHWAADYFTHVCTEVKLIEVADILEYRAIASKDLTRYQDTLDHWQDIDNDQCKTLRRLLIMQHVELKVLAEKQGLQLSETSFVSDVWLQIAECKRVFKWASVYEYYILADKDKNRSLFDDLLNKGAFVMEHLCVVARELRKYFATDAPAAEFEDFRERLCFKLSVAKNYFENMAIAIQRGYTDMKALRTMLCSRESVEQKPAEDVGTSSGVTGSTGVLSERICPHCKFSNDSSATVCVMCYH